MDINNSVQSVNNTQLKTKEDVFNLFNVLDDDKDNQSEFLKRIYIQHFEQITNINISTGKTGYLTNDPEYHIYEAFLEISFSDITVKLDWCRDMNSPRSIVVSIYHFIFNAIASGHFEKISINNKKAPLDSMLPYIFSFYPNHDYMIINDDYLEAFDLAYSLGLRSQELIKKGNKEKALEELSKKCMSLYSKSLHMKRSLGPSTFSNKHYNINTPNNPSPLEGGAIATILNKLKKAFNGIFNTNKVNTHNTIEYKPKSLYSTILKQSNCKVNNR